VRPFETDIESEYALSYPTSGIRSDLVRSFRESVLRVVEHYSFDTPLDAALEPLEATV
jgi:hypothetical protein